MSPYGAVVSVNRVTKTCGRISGSIERLTAEILITFRIMDPENDVFTPHF